MAYTRFNWIGYIVEGLSPLLFSPWGKHYDLPPARTIFSEYLHSPSIPVRRTT